MNKVILLGRITAKPELRYTNSNIPYTRFSIAINRTFANAQGQREADFINIIVWRKPAENVCNYMDKGSRVLVEGRIQTGNYDDKDGNKRYTFEVTADSVQFVDTKSQAPRTNESSPYDYQPQPSSPYDYQPQQNSVNVDTMPFASFGEEVAIDDNFLE